MTDIGIGAGLAALAFWGFIATAVVAGIWSGIRKREAEHETVRRLIESGKPFDQELLEKLSLVSDSRNSRPDREFKVTGLWLLPVSVGLLALGLILGAAVPQARAPILGAAALVACLGVGYLIAARIVGRWYPDDGDSAA